MTKHNFIVKYITFFTILVLSQQCFAAAWLLGSKQEKTIYTLSFFTSDNFVDKDGNRMVNPDQYVKRSLSVIYEEGILENLTIGSRVDIDSARQGSFENDGYSLSEIFLRTYLYNEGRNVVSIQPLLKLPAFEAPNFDIPLSNNEIEAELRLLWGHTFKYGRNYNFFEMDVAYRRSLYDHLDGSADKSELILDLSLGMRSNKNNIALLQLFTRKSLSSFNNLSLFQSNSDGIKLQLSHVWKWNRYYSLQLGAYADIYARNTGKGKAVFVSIWHEF